jgi:hypothetical protein
LHFIFTDRYLFFFPLSLTDVCTCTAEWQNKNQQNDDTDVIPEHIIRRDFIDEIIESTDYLFVNKTQNERESLLR